MLGRLSAFSGQRCLLTQVGRSFLSQPVQSLPKTIRSTFNKQVFASRQSRFQPHFVRHLASQSPMSRKEEEEVGEEKKKETSKKVEAEAQTLDTVQMRKDAEKQLGKLRQLFNQYGIVAIGTYGGIYVGTLFLLYGLIEQKVIGAGDAVSLLQSTGLDNFVDMSLVNSKAGNFALAWILTKFTEPLRLLLAVSITPTVARAIGWAPPKTNA